MELVRPSAHWFNCSFLTPKIPPCELNQKLPRPSSSISQITSFCSPCLVSIAENRPFLRRFNPPPKVPIHKVPSSSSRRHCTKSLERPLTRRNCCKVSPFNFPRPPPSMPNQTVPSLSCTTARTSGKIRPRLCPKDSTLPS